MAGTTEFKQLKCKTCGEPLDLNTAKDGVIKCAVCDSCFTLPKKEALPEVVNFLKQGEHDLDTGRFDDAHAAFAKAAEIDKTEPEAYWGMALAECRIQYLKDEANNRLQPICHEITDKDFEDNSNFLKALRYATDAQSAEYQRKGKEINYIKDEFYKLAQSGLDYDCFICVKVSDENGGRTQDYKIADDIYFELKGKGYKPFFSERELSGVTGADYEARILYALYSSECMLVVCFDEAYLRTKWVKNEYSRFLKLVNDEEKESDSIALVFGNRPVEKLPNRHGKIQGIAVNSLSAMERIVSFVDNHTPEAKRRREEAVRRREEEAKRKEKENEELRNELAELKKMFLNQQSARLTEEEAKRKAEEEKAKKEAAAAQAAAEAKQKTAPAPAKPKSDNSAFVIKDGVLTEYKGNAKYVVIPDGVTEIGDSAFALKSRIATVAMPDTVTEICDNAFLGCTGLTSINIPKGVKRIGSRAFCDSSALTNIVIPDSVTTMGSNAFIDCTGLVNVTLPNGFSDSLEKIFGKKIIASGKCRFDFTGEVKANAFSAKAAPVVTPAPTPSADFVIESGVLKKYKGNAAEVVIPDGVKAIGAWGNDWGGPFSGCTSLKSVTIPNSVKSIGMFAFNNCYNLKSITLPDSITEIDQSAFKGSGLTSITIPKNVSKFGGNPFGCCQSLESIAVDKNNAYFKSENNCLLSKDGKTLIAGCKNSVIPNGVMRIGSYAFFSCGISNATLPEGLKEIGEGAFYGQGDQIYVVYNKIESIVIPLSVEKIGAKAFWCCKSDMKIYCRASAKPVGWDKHWDDSSFNFVDVDNPFKFKNIIWGYKGNIAAPVANVAKPVPTPAPVKAVPPAKPAPAAKPTITANSDFIIEKGRLIGYKGTSKNVVIPDGVTVIGHDSFGKTLGGGPYQTKDYCLIESITIPDSVTEIYERFVNCTHLERIVVGSNNANYKSENNCLLSKDGKVLICSCHGLKEIKVPESVKIISDNAFAHYSLQNVYLPQGLERIGADAFACCFNLKEVVIPESVTNIGYWAFFGGNFTLKCRANKQPAQWNKDWNVKDKGKLFNSKHKVVWGYKGD